MDLIVNSWMGFSAIAGLLLIIVNYVKYDSLPQHEWLPGAAWTRACIYFCAANIFSAASGTLEMILTQPLFTEDQLANPYWKGGLAICSVYIFGAYFGLWGAMTLTFKRKHYLLPAMAFGIIWGASTGQLLLTFYHLWSLVPGIPGYANYILAYGCMGFWQYAIQDYWWDIYISPEHDNPKSIVVKTAVCHIPNVAICLTFLTFYDNYLIYVILQATALFAASIFQRFPAPWAEPPEGGWHAPLTKPGWWGASRGLGYIEESDPKLHPELAPANSSRFVASAAE